MDIKKDRHGIFIDLDGTILPDFFNVDKKAVEVCRELQTRGHMACIATGRNYLSALPVHKEIGLNNFLITYNGAYINYPSDKNILPIAITIANAVIESILDEKIIRDNLINFM